MSFFSFEPSRVPPRLGFFCWDRAPLAGAVALGANEAFTLADCAADVIRKINKKNTDTEPH